MSPGEEYPDVPVSAEPPADDSTRAPLLGRWRHWYALVIAMLVAWIIFLGWLTRSFR